MRDAMLFDASLWEAESWDAPTPEDVVDREPEKQDTRVPVQPVESETMLALLLPRPRRSH